MKTNFGMKCFAGLALFKLLVIVVIFIYSIAD